MTISKQDKSEKPLGNKPLGRKPIADKKVMLRIFVEQSIVNANGGEQSCKDECVLFLTERGQESVEKNELNANKNISVPQPGQVVYYQGSTYIFLSMNMGGKCRLKKRLPPYSGKVFKDIDVSQIKMDEL